jgi:hypothetical protein
LGWVLLLGEAPGNIAPGNIIDFEKDKDLITSESLITSCQGNFGTSLKLDMPPEGGS